jgi:Pyruvate/2-oxoacid:ferredoxin oxidoreductase gamma subunit
MRMILKGSAGQGVQLMSYVLANVLKDSGYNVSMMSEYTPLMRSGDSVAKLVFSMERIDNPLVEEADVSYDLSDEAYKEIKVKNMHVIGIILKSLKLELNDEIKMYLPSRFVEENMLALRVGYDRTDGLRDTMEIIPE